jgi:hypothetical protein
MEPKDHVKQVNCEQKRQIEIYKWIESERAGRDVSDNATLEWIQRYARGFREWAETIPYGCTKCGLCSDCANREECCRPFDEERLQRIKSKRL